jgi:hypothetical protein
MKEKERGVKAKRENITICLLSFDHSIQKDMDVHK